MDNREKAIQTFLHYQTNPVAWCNEVARVTLDPWQDEAFRNLVEHKFLAIKSGSGVGKTKFMSLATIWFLSTHPMSRVPSTAPSQHQLFDALWGEHFKIITNSPILNKLLEWTQTKVQVRGYEPIWYAVARTSKVRPGSDVAEGLQGFHEEKNIMFVLDESSGIPDAIYPAVEGAFTTEGCYCVMTSNPTRREGFFYEIFNNPEMRKFYKTMHVSCLDSPRVTERYIEMMRIRYGENHPVFMFKVLGEFPEISTDTLIPPSYIESMINSDKPDSSIYSTELGVDIGRTYSPSVICARQGYEVLNFHEHMKKGGTRDTQETVAWINDYISEYKPTRVKVDAVSGGGGVYDLLRELYGDMIVPVYGQATQMEDDDKKRFLNLRAKGYWELRDLIPDIYCAKKFPDRVIAELSDLRTLPALGNKVKIESKDDMLIRGKRSPDYADAMMYAFLDSSLCMIIKEAQPLSPLMEEVTAELKQVSMWHDMTMVGKRSKSKWGKLRG